MKCIVVSFANKTAQDVEDEINNRLIDFGRSGRHLELNVKIGKDFIIIIIKEK